MEVNRVCPECKQPVIYGNITTHQDGDVTEVRCKHCNTVVWWNHGDALRYPYAGFLVELANRILEDE